MLLIRALILFLAALPCIPIFPSASPSTCDTRSRRGHALSYHTRICLRAKSPSHRAQAALELLSLCLIYSLRCLQYIPFAAQPEHAQFVGPRRGSCSPLLYVDTHKFRLNDGKFTDWRMSIRRGDNEGYC
ncbi:hypothetical protein CPB85DRAFT_105121 [Mucidula mucida]|nr:hypothetical protein CPB85DRAFT_105121 [Mucidula mucida]